MRVNVGYHVGRVSVAVERNGISTYYGDMTRSLVYRYDKPGGIDERFRYSLTVPRMNDEEIRTTGGEK